MRRALGLAMAAVLAVAGAVEAQKTVPVHPGKGGSPHVRTTWTVDGANITIEYGRPSLKGRSEAALMPPGQEWRTGADEATTLTVEGKGLMIGSLMVAPGKYTLYTVPGDKQWQLVVSKKTGQWGVPYPGAGEDLGRAPMTVSKNAAPVEQLTISVEDTPAGGNLIVSWGTAKATAAFVVH